MAADHRNVTQAEWLCQLLECGLLRGSYVPPREFGELWDLTRYRKSLISDRQRQASRLHKVLEDAGVKLAGVATGVLGVSGRAMLDALIAGTRDPEVLADLARGKIPRAPASTDRTLLSPSRGNVWPHPCTPGLPRGADRVADRRGRRAFGFFRREG
jgi:hypothetical protein